MSLTLLQGHSETPASQTPPESPDRILPQTPLETPPIPSLLTTTEVDKDTEEDPEQVSKVGKKLQDLANGVVDETLPRLTEEDLAFDSMDEVVVEEEDFVEEDSDDDGDDENDIGWINEEEPESGT